MDLRDLIDQQIGLHEQLSDYDIQEGFEGGAFRRHRKIFIGVDGPVTVGKWTLHRLDCGHIIGSKGGEELAGRCQKCGGWVCHRCFDRCRSCQKLLCPHCTKIYENTVYCRKCMIKARLKRGVLFLLREAHSGLSK